MWNSDVFNQGGVLGVPASQQYVGNQFTGNNSMPGAGYIGGGSAGGGASDSFFNSDAFKGLFGDGGIAGGLAMGMQGLAGIGNLFMGNSQLKLAKQNLGFQKEAFYANMRNSIQSYNTAMADRINSRYSDREKTQAEKDEMIEKNSLKG